MTNLNLTLLQSDLSWENARENINHFTRLIDGIKDSTDIILLPETFNTGFSMNPSQQAETMEGESITFLKRKSAERQCLIMGSLLITENGSYFNRFVAVYPNGEVLQYDKRHLFRLSREADNITAGKEKVIIPWKGWKISPMICYDLRFPVWNKNRLINGEFEYDLLVFVANWPKVRARFWKPLLVARAIENQCFVAAVNRIGNDGFGRPHTGESMIINPDGEVIATEIAEKESVISKEILYDDLLDCRKNYPFALDWDSFTIQP